MKSTHLPRLVWAAIGHLFAAVVVVGMSASCGSEQRGVTNNQPESTLAPGQCLSNGSTCTSSAGCCSQWCVNGSCVKQHP